MQTPKSWYQRYDSAAATRRGRTVPAAPLSAEADLAFDFHRQWGHVANEDALEQLVRYYDLPSISLRNVIWHSMKANTTFHGLRLHELYYDRIHPSDYGHSILAHGLIHLFRKVSTYLEAPSTAHGGGEEQRHSSRLTTIQQGSHDVDSPNAPSGGTTIGASDTIALAYSRTPAQGPNNLRDWARSWCRRSSLPVPRPMLPNVAGAAARRLDCHDADSLWRIVDRSRCHGWAHVIERSPSGVPKPGWLADRAGSSCVFAYDVERPHRSNGVGDSPAAHRATPVIMNRVGIGYLRSYEHMGTVRVDCVDDCTCEGIDIDAHTEERISPLDLKYFSAQLPARPNDADAWGSARNASSDSSGSTALGDRRDTSYNGTGAALSQRRAGGTWRCGVRVTVLNATSSGEHKFKLTVSTIVPSPLYSCISSLAFCHASLRGWNSPLLCACMHAPIAHVGTHS